MHVNQERLKFWTEKIQTWEKNNLSQAEYCRQNNLILIDDYAKYNPARPHRIIKGVNYPFITRAIEEAHSFSRGQKILYRLQGVGPIEKIFTRLLKQQPFKGLLIWLRGTLEVRVMSQVKGNGDRYKIPPDKK